MGAVTVVIKWSQLGFKTGLADKLFVLIIILLHCRCERDAEVQLQPLQQVNGVDKNNLFKVSLPCMYM